VKKQTFEQINQQQSKAYRKRSGAMPTVLIERSDKTITVGNLDMRTQDVLFTEDGQIKAHPNVPAELLTDEHQQKLAAVLAGVALRGSEQTPLIEEQPKDTFASVTAEMNQLGETISDKDRVAVWRYATAVHDYEIHNAFAQLQPEVRAVAMQMRDLYDKRSKTRSQ
jgi:hypothetical protein